MRSSGVLALLAATVVVGGCAAVGFESDESRPFPLEDRIYRLLVLPHDGVLTWRGVGDPVLEFNRNGAAWPLRQIDGVPVAFGRSPSGDSIVIASQREHRPLDGTAAMDTLSVFETATSRNIDATITPLGWSTFAVAVDDEATTIAAAVATSDSVIVPKNVVRYAQVGSSDVRTVSFAATLDIGEDALVDQLFFDGDTLLVNFGKASCLVAAVPYRRSSQARCLVRPDDLPANDIDDPIVEILSSCGGRIILEVHPRTNPPTGRLFTAEDGQLTPLDGFPQSVHGYGASLDCEGTLATQAIDDPTKFNVEHVSR